MLCLVAPAEKVIPVSVNQKAENIQANPYFHTIDY